MAPTPLTYRHWAVLRLGRCFVLLIATWCATREAPGSLFATVAQKQVALVQLKAADLQELKSMKSDLEEKLRSIRLPAPTSVMAFGKMHPVPSTVEEPEEPPPDMLRYLSGHFAGSGSISSTQARLIVSESGPDVSNLFLFQKYFGGGVRVRKRGSGLQRPRIEWQVSGSNALRAARMLSESKLQKHMRLLDMAEGRFCTEDGQGKVAFQHWSEVAGFLDVCMCLEAYARRNVKLQIRGPQQSLLQALASFFQGKLGVETSISTYSSGGGSKYQLQAGWEGARPILAAALENGLLLQREAAETFLGWTPDRHWEVRQKLQEFKGYNERFSRLGEDGAGRAREILRLQGQLRRKQAKEADVNEINRLEQQLAERVSKHQRLQLVEEIQRLQAHLQTVQAEVATASAAKMRA